MAAGSCSTSNARQWGSWILALAIVAAAGTPVWAGFNNNGNFGNRVGGISVDARGVVARPDVATEKADFDELRKAIRPAPAELMKPVGMRMISLKRVEAALAEVKRTGGEIPADVRFMAGIQRIQYVLVYPDQQDIVLAGPGEGWKLDPQGNVVGVSTGRPVIQFDDFLVALRVTLGTRGGQISCSIDPTAEGRERFAQFMGRQKTFNSQVLAGAAAAMGQQTITVSGVPDTSHLARVLVAADFRMKQIAMNLTASPVPTLPSYLEALANSKVPVNNMTPRWWLACNYDALHRSEDGLAWEIRGPGVKCMTEEEVIGAGGTVQAVGPVNAVAQKWASQFTAKYDELSAKDSVFADLRNVMDLCVVAALIDKHDLIGKAGASFPVLTSRDSAVQTSAYFHAPKFVATECSFIKRGREYIITASGGVDVNAPQVVARSEMSLTLPKVHTTADGSQQTSWWW